MKNISKSLTIILGFSCLLVFTDCSNKSGDTSKKRDNYTGTWELEKTTCDGDEVSHSGLSDVFKLDKESSRGVNTVTSSSNCIARTNFKIRKTGSVMIFENNSYACRPSGCSVNYSVTFDGKRTDYRHSCPGDFPSNSKIRARLSVNGNSFTTELTSTNGMNCVNTYRRRE